MITEAWVLAPVKSKDDPGMGGDIGERLRRSSIIPNSQVSVVAGCEQICLKVVELDLGGAGYGSQNVGWLSRLPDIQQNDVGVDGSAGQQVFVEPTPVQVCNGTMMALENATILHQETTETSHFPCRFSRLFTSWMLERLKRPRLRRPARTTSWP